MTTTVQSIQSISSAASDRSIAALTAAFSGDPVTRWVMPDAHQYLTYFPSFAAAMGGAAFEAGSAHAADGFSGVALWLPPGVGPDDETMGPLAEEAVPAADQDEVFGFMGQMAEFHPHEPHWYLPLIGVDPAHQGRGLGSRLMQHALETCDRDGALAYLEATSPRSKALYERHGFVATGVIQHGSSPQMWPMVRKPR